MSKLIIGDLHFGNHKPFAGLDENGVNTRFLHQLRAFHEILDYAQKMRVSHIVQLGDVFHVRGKVEADVVNLVKRELVDFADDFPITMLTGNHDITVPGDIFNLAMLLSHVGSNRVVASPETDGNLIYMPFVKDGFEQAVDDLLGGHKKKEFVLFMHQTIVGSRYNGQIMDHGVDLGYVKQFKRVFCGDIHTPSDLAKNVHNVGTPYPLAFGDESVYGVTLTNDDWVPIDRFYPKHPRFITTEDQTDVNNEYDFFRVIGGIRPKGNTRTNVKIVPVVEEKSEVRLNSTTPKKVIEAYCKSMNSLTMVEEGIKILEASKS